MKYAPAVMLSLLSLALLSPGLVMLYLALFGTHFTDIQATCGFLLFFLGIPTVLGAFFAWDEVTR